MGVNIQALRVLAHNDVDHAHDLLKLKLHTVDPVPVLASIDSLQTEIYDILNVVKALQDELLVGASIMLKKLLSIAVQGAVFVHICLCDSF